MPVTTPQGTLDFKKVDRVTFVGASSNTVIDTTTGSLGVGVGVGGPTSNLHVVGNALISSNLTVGGNVSDLNVVSNVNMLHTSNTSSIKLNSNVVAEFPRSKGNLKKYPQVALTTNTLTNGYGVSASSENNGTSTGQAYRLFDGNFKNNRGYHSAVAYADGVYTGSASITDANGYVHSGEWIKLQMPTSKSIKLQGFTFFTRSEAGNYKSRIPNDGVFLGSGDGINWYPIHYFYGIEAEERQCVKKHFQPVNHSYYNHFALVAYTLARNSLATALNFAELELLGTTESDEHGSGTDVVFKSVVNSPPTDSLELYYDAKNLENGSSVSSVDDLKPSGTAINGTASGTVTVSDKAFAFNSTTSDRITATTTLSGNQVVTVAVWVKLSDLTTAQHYICELGGPTGHNRISLYYSDNFGIRVVVVNDYRTRYHPKPNEWVHLAFTYEGGVNSHWTRGEDSIRMYINGEIWKFESYYGNDNSNPLLNLPSSSLFQFPGRNGTIDHHMDSSIANIRLYSRVLTQSEIWNLYAYQKESFGHGDLSMILKNGRLGIGKVEPEATLDVNGTIQAGNMPLKFYVIEGTSPSSGTILEIHEFPEGINLAKIVHISGVTVSATGSVGTFIRHGSGQWEVDIWVYANGSPPRILLSGFDATTSSNFRDKKFRLFIATM
ncbi:hypothetical protein MPVG_00156 [Micromonas pusilla virus 12T]|uniref:hypothetical protein n=1 Tax=Micromonas pusilla virus 12T TaxID=755272 RepID=UPI0002C15068|nr:hypothetical protein MPVG_00156 [Micromonas pusilla virus 12T]AGH30976.1 hypothetical protein MPVG_00156 [Micromonas pusilla virus 12T]